MSRKISSGLFLTAISAILAIAGFIAYMVNTGTSYFASLGVSPVVAGCAAAAIVCQVVYLAAGLKGHPVWADILPVASSALMMVATITFLSVRVAGIASIMTFESNASNQADMTGAIVGIALCLVATVFSMVASFFDITKE